MNFYQDFISEPSNSDANDSSHDEEETGMELDGYFNMVRQVTSEEQQDEIEEPAETHRSAKGELSDTIPKTIQMAIAPQTLLVEEPMFRLNVKSPKPVQGMRTMRTSLSDPNTVTNTFDWLKYCIGQQQL